MVDPFSMVTGVAGLLSLTIQLIDVGVKFTHDLKDSISAPREFLQEVQALADVLGQLKDFLTRQQSQPFPFNKTSLLYSTNLACEQKLRKVLSKLERFVAAGTQQKKISKAVQRVKWPFAAKEQREVIEDLHRFVQVFMFGLTAEGCYLLSESTAEASSILKAQLKVLNEVKTLCYSLPDLVSNVKQASKSVASILAVIAKLPDHSLEITKISSGISRLEAFANGQLEKQASEVELEESQKLLDGFSTLSFYQKHSEVFERHQEGTFQWLLQDKIFSAWMQGSGKSLLWAVGLPGAGKTVLTSIIIQHLRSSITDISLAYFYFDYKVADDQTTADVLWCLLRQLAECNQIILKLAMQLFKNTTTGTRPTLKDATNLFREISESKEKCYLVLDALDEFPETSESGTEIRNALLEVFRGLPNTFRILITSRPNVNLQSTFKDISKLKVEASQGDLNNFIESRISTSLRLKAFVSKDPGLEGEIVEKVSEKSNGMFLLAQLQLEQISSAMTAREVRKCLQKLSEKLNGMYEDAIIRIKTQATAQSALAMRVLSWIAYARRPLYVDELVHGLSIEGGDTAIDESGFVDIDTIISCCEGLVQLETEMTKYDPKFRTNVEVPEYVTVRFVHYTVQEFIVSSTHWGRDRCNWDIAQASLTYLSFPELERAYAESRTHRARNHPFLDYAHFWPVHVASLEQIPDPDLVMSLFTKSAPHSTIIPRSYLFTSGNSAWNNWVNMTLDYRHKNNIQTQFPTVHSHLISVIFLDTFGASNVIRLLLAQDTYGNALCSALARGIYTIANQILAIVGNRKFASRALYVCVWKNHREYIDRFLKAGADVNYCETDIDPTEHYYGAESDIGICPTTLQMAVEFTSLEITQKLIAAGADVNSTKGGQRLTRNHLVLKIAFERGDKAIIKLLISAGVKLRSTYLYEPFLTTAIQQGMDDIAHVLIDAGADVNGYSWNHGVPLHQALLKNDIEMATYLVKAGANPHGEVSEEYFTCMGYVIQREDGETLKALLDAGASPDKGVVLARMFDKPSMRKILIDAGGSDVPHDDEAWPRNFLVASTFMDIAEDVRDIEAEEEMDAAIEEMRLDSS